MGNATTLRNSGEATTITGAADGQRMLRVMRDAFTDKTKVLLELMQNARRAGSKSVHIEYDRAAKLLVVTDDGCGIEDFQVLLTMASTGWDAETAAIEQSFGIGFWSGVYGSERLQVESRGKGFICDTADIIAAKPIALYDCEQKRTVIRLMGLTKELQDLDFRKAARGFPIPVWLNGEELPRPRAITGEFQKTSVGHVKLGSAVGLSTIAYLQGFEIGHFNSGYRCDMDGATIVHLDSTMFRARLPDRDCLVDAKDAEGSIIAAVKGVWREHFKRCKAQGQHKPVLEAGTFLATVGAIDLLNDIPVLPSCFLSDYNLDSFMCGDFSNYSEPIPDLAREAAASAVLLLDDGLEENGWTLEELRFGDDTYAEEVRSDFNTTQYLALAKAMLVSGLLDSRHWVFGLKNLHRKPPILEKVEILEAVPAVEIEGRCISHTFVPCGAIRFVGSLGTVESPTALAITEDEEFDIAVTPGASLSDLLKMLSSFTDGSDHYQDDWYDADYDKLDMELALARGADVEMLIRNALGSLLSGSASKYLKGKRFSVSFTEQEGSYLKLNVVQQGAGRKAAKKPKGKATVRGKGKRA